MARPVEDRAEAILAAARELLLRGGGQDATVDAVAARAGVGKGTVFLYWPTKTRLHDAVVRLEIAALLASLADELRSGVTRLSVGHVVRREIAAVLEVPSLAPQVPGDPGSPVDSDEFPGLALHRIISIMQAHGLVRGVPTAEIVSAFKIVMAGSVIVGLKGPEMREVLLNAAEHLVNATYDRADADPADIAAAMPEVLDALEDAIDQLVEVAAPDRPTSAVLRPRERPATTGV
ncbi:TetR/AcrR family transcriptional regulator [Promicromonospora sp. NPDC057488]|uniref:TetR/AcrR family transcriptional regulator n=1 Tax=Promicromonospora sp. NPDC057488 TaxID=3346147 RepID=UPI0036709244